MRRIIKKLLPASLALALALTAFAPAGAAPAGSGDPRLAADTDARVAARQGRFERQGYTLVDTVANAYRYAFEPTGDYVWGTVQYTYQRPCSGEICVGTDYGRVVVEIVAADAGYVVDRVTVDEWIVY